VNGVSEYERRRILQDRHHSSVDDYCKDSLQVEICEEKISGLQDKISSLQQKSTKKSADAASSAEAEAAGSELLKILQASGYDSVDDLQKPWEAFNLDSIKVDNFCKDQVRTVSCIQEVAAQQPDEFCQDPRLQQPPDSEIVGRLQVDHLQNLMESSHGSRTGCQQAFREIMHLYFEYLHSKAEKEKNMRFYKKVWTDWLQPLWSKLCAPKKGK